MKAGWERAQDRQSMERLHEVGRALVSEQNLDRLLDLILTKARELLKAEAGSIYLLSGEGERRELLFAHTQNARVKLPFHRIVMPVSDRTLAGFVALTRESLTGSTTVSTGRRATVPPPCWWCPCWIPRARCWASSSC